MTRFLVLFLLIALPKFTFASEIDELKNRLKGPQAGAHQGGIFGKGANSLAQFEVARLAGADIVEMDLHLTKDNVVVVFHDDDLSPLTNCKGLVKNKTWQEIYENCQYFNGQPLPNFEQVLAWSSGRIIINAEFKESAVIPGALALVGKYQAHAWTYFQCNKAEYAEARSIDPEIALLYSLGGPQDLAWATQNTDPALIIFEVDEKSHSQEILKALKATGRLISEDAWHFTRLWEFFGAACDNAYAAGIDIAISNRPKGCVAQRNKWH